MADRQLCILDTDYNPRPVSWSECALWEESLFFHISSIGHLFFHCPYAKRNPNVDWLRLG
jgi:hypothetical protein